MATVERALSGNKIGPPKASCGSFRSARQHQNHGATYMRDARQTSSAK
jgi:hypothetical protein